MNDLDRLKEMAGILNEGMAEEQLLTLFAALQLAIENHQTLTPQELAEFLTTYAPDVVPLRRAKTFAARKYKERY